MIVGSIIEDRKIESRVALTPENVKKFLGLGFKVLIEKKYGWKPSYNLDKGFDATLKDFVKNI